MSSRHTERTAYRSAVATAVTMVALFTLAACGGGGDDDEANPSAPKKSSASSSASTDAGDDEVDTSKVIGELKGANGIEIAVHSAVRDAGGFVTVSGTLYNKGDRTFRAAEWRSEETAIKSKSSIAGATLIDKSGKKRYMVLRDTDGQCLCTTGLAGVQPGESRPVFAQFPAPPANVAAVEFHVPSMSPVTLELTEG